MHDHPQLTTDHWQLTNEMFRIKICGITNVEDAVAAVDAGADAIGLNFYEKSPRCVSASQATRIAESVTDRAEIVGVVVNKDAKQLQQLLQQTRFPWIQLHGDEPPQIFHDLLKVEFLSDFPFQSIRARRLGEGGTRAIALDLNACCLDGGGPSAVLIDAASSGAYGGTGCTVDWNSLVMHESWLGGFPILLAGGLTPDNVAEAIRIVRPAAVDVASGVELSPGKKDPHKVRDFVAAAKAAFESLGV
jgi:phosphoribosylanthranilate isomerase